MLKKASTTDNRLRLVALFFFALAGWVLVRLFILQVVEHDYYSLFALNSHEIYQQLHPKRGEILFQDTRTKQEYPVAVNKQYYLIYAVPKDIPAAEVATTSAQLAALFGYDTEEKKQQLTERLNKNTQVYRPLEKKVPEETMLAIKAKNLAGIYATPQEFRYYPEGNIAGPLLGFVNFNDAGDMVGNYGVEGYWNKKIAGKPGFVLGARGALGSWITLAGRTLHPSEDGADLLLTIDRTLQYMACERLRQGLVEYQAKSAALVMMDPKTGAILAMCSLPDFDPNNYSSITDLSVFNNRTVFTPYEPGSVFKPITMAIALELGLVQPETTFVDPCERKIAEYTIHNALDKCYGRQTMIGVLENSINTGMIWIEEKIGSEKFKKYAEKFGFGERTGITLGSEAPGDISSLSKKSPIYGAVGSFGQGLTATPIQLAAAYSALVNDGQLPKPYLVEEVRYPDGHKDKTLPQLVEQVISPRAAKLISGMLVSVVDKGASYRLAKFPDYYIGGKTGTAQIAGQGGYGDRTNQTLVGFATARDPRVVVVVKYEEPARKFAESTAAPVFHDIMKFVLDYYTIPKER